jgi:hypothetical protein
MDNVALIVIMFLVAAINTFIVATAIHLIFKIRISKEVKNDLVREDSFGEKKEGQTEPLKSESSFIKKENNLMEDLSMKSKIENEKKEEISTEQKKEEEPKFKKYTSKGYIDPEKDIKKKQHIWR